MDRGKVISKAVRMQTSKADRANSTGHETAREVALTTLPWSVAEDFSVVSLFGQITRRGRMAR